MGKWIFISPLFVGMKAEPSQFRIELPPSMKINPSEPVNLDAYAEYKYYLAGDTDKELMIIANKMHDLATQGHSIKVRPHPRYSDLNKVRIFFSETEIENPKLIGIIDPISNSEYVVGSYSTVLSQAYFSGIKIVVDDLACKEQFDKLASLHYILANSNNLRLSQV